MSAVIGMPYTTCANTRRGIPAGKFTSSNSCVSGIITAWYGMKRPKRKNVKTKSAPGKRHFDKTNPFSEPSTVDRIVAGIASLKLFARFGERSFQAVRHASNVQTCGHDHAWLGSISATPFTLVTSRTYSGVRIRIAKSSSATYLSGVARRRRLRAHHPGSTGTGTGGAAVVVLTRCAPTEPCRSGTG